MEGLVLSMLSDASIVCFSQTSHCNPIEDIHLGVLHTLASCIELWTLRFNNLKIVFMISSIPWVGAPSQPQKLWEVWFQLKGVVTVKTANPNHQIQTLRIIFYICRPNYIEKKSWITIAWASQACLDFNQSAFSFFKTYKSDFRDFSTLAFVENG